MTDQANLYCKTNGDFKIRILPLFLEEQSSDINSIYYWVYKIDIENSGEEVFEIINYHWKIINFNGLIKDIKGNKGFNVEKAIIEPGATFSYNSTVHLNTPSGLVIGSFKLKNLRNDEEFNITTPTFSLDSPYEHHLPS